MEILSSSREAEGEKRGLWPAAKGVGSRKHVERRGTSQSPGVTVERRKEEGGCLRWGWTLLLLAQGEQDSCLVVMQSKYPGAEREKHKLSLGGR